MRVRVPQRQRVDAPNSRIIGAGKIAVSLARVGFFCVGVKTAVCASRVSEFPLRHATFSNA